MQNKPLSQRGLTIGQVAQRTGLAVSAIRFYEEKGVVFPLRDSSGQRRFARSDLRRLSFAMIAQKLGLRLSDIAREMGSLPQTKAPSKADWSRISTSMRDDLQARIDQLTKLRDNLDGCIGCGCLSLEACALYNPEDHVAAKGAGPRLVSP